MRGITGTTVTAPVTFSYAETLGRTGAIANGASHTTGVDTTVTLTTKTLGAVIYYTIDGSGISDLKAAKRINASSGSLFVPLTTVSEQRAISAVAVGPNMRPSPITTAKVEVTPNGTPNQPIIRVTYHNNEGIGIGSVPEDSRDYKPGDRPTVMGNGSLASSTHDFHGWNTAQDGSGTTYRAGATLPAVATNVTLYAQWINYGVTYNANLSPILGTIMGTGTPSGAALTTGATMPTGSDRYRSTVSVTLEAPQLNGSDVQRNTSGQYLSTATANPAELQLLGNGTYVFDGWYTTDVSSGGTGTSYHVGDTLSMPANNVTLYAKWKQRYTITFDRNEPCTLTPSFTTTATNISNLSPSYTGSPTISISQDGNMNPAPSPITYLHGAMPPSTTAPASLVDRSDYPMVSGSNSFISCNAIGSRVYYQFSNWRDTSNNPYNSGASLNGSAIENTDMTLSAQWTWQYNGGSYAQ